MNTSNVCGAIHVHDRPIDLEHPGAAGPARHPAARQAYLDRVRADRDLILQSWEPARAPVYAPMPIAAGTTLDVGAVEVPSGGYASPGETGGITGGVGEGIAAPATATVTKRELSFLDDRSLTIEEKVFRFMILMTKKADQEVVAKMKEISANKTPTSGSSGSSGGGTTAPPPASTGEPTDAGPTDPGSASDPGSPSDPPVNPALPPPYDRMTLDEMHEKYGFDGMLNILQRGDPARYAGLFSAFDKLGPVLADGVALAAHELGPALALGVTAMGLPELAPIVNMLGTKVGDAVGEEVRSLAHRHDAAAPSPQVTDAVRNGIASAGSILASSADSSATTSATVAAKASSSSANSTASAMDEKVQALELQRLMEKQNTMFELLSNVLKSMHDARMAVVQNLR